ncbi:methyltransferase domain-containing protein [Streptomyces ipomoeae]|uniref:Protein-L-isoaspartate O-methyltransferase n=2 Tax=Streptomyces ipomoeae TaxID=103232 RepID=A0AAE8VWQ3_9ACTN|nr:methyltransferase domain-containing protein [Streptomyces ipomoeae]
MTMANVGGAEWADAFRAVPRSAFLPDVMWPFDMDTGRGVTVRKADDPEAWRAYADADVPIVTQWDGGEGDGLNPGLLATSSASMPSVVRSMLADLDVHPGHRVLEIGTGTGYNAALLAHRVGPGNVVTVEVDGGVAATARAALRRFGLPVEVITGDGLLGHAAGAPYDRIIATCGLRRIPYAWVRQTRPGGLIVVPWGTDYGREDAVARLVVAADGTRASGRFTGPVEFMKLRAQRRAWPRHDDYMPAEGVSGGDRSSTTLTEVDFVRGPFDPLRFALGLRVPACLCAVADKRDGVRPVWLYGLSDRSWACVIFRDGEPASIVHQGGPRRLWDETEAARGWWKERGEPGFERFGLTVDERGTYAWLDDPSASWPA